MSRTKHARKHAHRWEIVETHVVRISGRFREGVQVLRCARCPATKRRRLK